jgi:hypothetical protein
VASAQRRRLVIDFGPFYSVRLRPAVFQRYKVATLYASLGDVLVVNGGDVADDYGLMPDLAMAPTRVRASAPTAPAMAA